MTLSRSGFIPTEPSTVGAQFGHSRGSPRYSDHPEVPVLLSAPGPIRTGDLQVRSLTLYPAELRAQGTKSATYHRPTPPDSADRAPARVLSVRHERQRPLHVGRDRRAARGVRVPGHGRRHTGQMLATERRGLTHVTHDRHLA